MLNQLRAVLSFLIFVSFVSFGQQNDSQFLKSLAGINYQIDQINRDILVLQNASLSSREISQRIHELEQDINSVKELFLSIVNNSNSFSRSHYDKEIKDIRDKLSNLEFEDLAEDLSVEWKQDDAIVKGQTLLQARDYTDKEISSTITYSIAICSLVFTAIGLFVGITQYNQSKATKSVKEESDRDLRQFEDETKKRLDKISEKHLSDIERLTIGHEAKLARLEKLNMAKIQDAQDAYSKLMAENEMKNGLIYKNLAVALYGMRYLVEDNYSDYLDPSELDEDELKKHENNKFQPSVLHELISIQKEAIKRFSFAMDEVLEAAMLYYESHLDLAYYKCEMTRYGKLRNDAITRIKSDLSAFEGNIQKWVDIEIKNYEDNLDEFINRAAGISDSILFVKMCIGEAQICNAEVAKERVCVLTEEILENNTNLDVLNVKNNVYKMNYEFYWKKYDTFSDDRKIVSSLQSMS